MIAALLTAPSAPSSNPPCVKQAEVTDMILFMLPGAIDAAGERCRATLPRDAYLFTGARRLSESLAAESKDHAAGAVTAFEKISGEKMPAELSQDTVGRMIGDVIRSKLVGEIKPEMCGDINALAELLAPLPPANLGGIATLLIGIDQKKGRKTGKGPHVCQASSL